MSLKILQNGTKYNAKLNTATLTGDVDIDRQLVYITGLKAGRLVCLASTGVALAVNGAAGTNTPIGVVVVDAAGNFLENSPALASKKLAVLMGNCVYITDQWTGGETYAPGDKLYLGAGGLFTKVAPTAGAGVNTDVIGIADSVTNTSNPELTVIQF